MTDSPAGSILWHDLTVADAPGVRDFYEKVVGWKPAPVSMGDYDDYSMHRSGDNECVAGVCHARGMNANVPPQWLIYVKVDSADAAAEKAVAAGGKILDGPRPMGAGRFVVVQDPAGAVIALIDNG